MKTLNIRYSKKTLLNRRNLLNIYNASFFTLNKKIKSNFSGNTYLESITILYQLVAMLVFFQIIFQDLQAQYIVNPEVVSSYLSGDSNEKQFQVFTGANSQQVRESEFSAHSVKKTIIMQTDKYLSPVGLTLSEGLYRAAGVGFTFMITPGSATTMYVSQWQTATSYPPENKSYYYNTGSAHLMPDGKTWRTMNRDVKGYCCGNNVSMEFQVLSPTKFTILRHRMWGMNSPEPSENLGWQGGAANEFNRVENDISYPKDDISFGLRDSGARFSSMSGKVLIFHDGETIKDAEFAKLDQVIYVLDHIVTEEESTVIIGQADLSTFIIKEESEIFITVAPEHDSKIGLVAGTIWGNMKKMWKDGTMEIEMSQACMGIKGTTFVLEERQGSSTTKVLEGVVEVTSKRTQQKILVNAGYMVTATATGLSPLKKFSTVKEEASWEALRTSKTSTSKSKNLALNRPAKQSSTCRWSKVNDAQGAVDGVKNGSYGFHTDIEKNPWWQIDLGEVISLTEVRIFNRLELPERARTLQVLLSNDGTNWKKFFTNDGTVFGGSSISDSKPLKVSLKGQSARFIRLQLNETNCLHLDEVEIY